MASGLSNDPNDRVHLYNEYKELIYEKVNWLYKSNSVTFSLEECKFIEGPKTTIVNHTEFCDMNLFLQLTEKKNLIETSKSETVWHEAKVKLLPFEVVKSFTFINKEATKLANIDAAMDFMLTNMEKQGDFSLPIYFADVCAGPGAFSEYLSWKRGWDYKGFGITLKGPNDFTLEKSSCTNFATFQKLYGKNEDGDIRNPENIRDFVDKVRNETDHLGVHLMLSDGSHIEDENYSSYCPEEIMLKNLHLCQCYLALEVLRPHGTFVTKLFEVFTPFSAGLLYLIYLCFERVSILKPVTSRVSTSERYLICNDLRNDARTKGIRRYLATIAEKLWNYRDSPENDILEIVPLNVIKTDKTFYEYLRASNARIAREQLVSLLKLVEFYKVKAASVTGTIEGTNTINNISSGSVIGSQKKYLTGKCLNYFQIPYEAVSEDSYLLFEFLTLYESEMKQKIPQFNLDAIRSTFNTFKDNYMYCFLASNRNEYPYNFYFAKNNTVYKITKTKRITVNNITLSNDTLIYGELVKEYQEDGTKYRDSLHVIDAISLGTTYLGRYNFKKRLELIERFCKAHNKESDLLRCRRIRPKIFKTLDTLKNDLPSNGETPFDVELPTLGYQSQKEVFKAKSVLIYNITEMTFQKGLNKSYLVSNSNNVVNIRKLYEAL
ncbi:cap-specific mRNA (nucleoside-2'-O-)-methyltransferase 1-like [Rhynchophorus ferrugineus]|uniref:cap-specific mRNA (nucleoside-2'-O-)-methyltransferase 1-like n=1 Tax=Rhynchophorus ferrugineus TaxID=354439 RepID=UPI003FCE0FA7